MKLEVITLGISEKLKELRENLGLNKRELSNQLNIPYSTYNNWEIGTREPNSEYLIKFAEFYKVTIDYLLDYTEINTIAAHALDDLTEDEQQKIIEFARFIKSQRVDNK